MQRQQLVLLALRRAVKPCALVPRLPELIDIAGDSLWTNLAPRDMPDIMALAQRVDASKVARFAFVPPTIPEYLNAIAVGKVHAMVASAFTASASPRIRRCPGRRRTGTVHRPGFGRSRLPAARGR